MSLCHNCAHTCERCGQTLPTSAELLTQYQQLQQHIDNVKVSIGNHHQHAAAERIIDTKFGIDTP